MILPHNGDSQGVGARVCHHMGYIVDKYSELLKKRCSVAENDVHKGGTAVFQPGYRFIDSFLWETTSIALFTIARHSMILESLYSSRISAVLF